VRQNTLATVGFDVSERAKHHHGEVEEEERQMEEARCASKMWRRGFVVIGSKATLSRV
jgi:hypothetical protein